MKLFQNHHVQYLLGAMLIAITIVVVVVVAASYVIENIKP